MKVVCHLGGHFYYTPKVLECLYLALNSFLVTCGLGLRPNPQRGLGARLSLPKPEASNLAPGVEWWLSSKARG